jgi:hypothetical protein
MSVGRINYIRIYRPCFFQRSSVKLPTRLCPTTALLATALGLLSCATAYFAVSAGVALVHGESTAMLKNERGVTMELETKARGLRFNIATSGLRIALAGEQGCAAMQAHQ